MNNFYVYFHINPLKNEVFYVGRGTGRRAYQKAGRNTYWKNVVSKYGFIVNIVEDNLTMSEANKREIFYISFFGRRDKGKGPLINLTNGGDGVGLGNKHGAGNKHRVISEETRKKMSEAKKGKPSWNKGKAYPMSDATKIKISTTMKIRFQNEIHPTTGREPWNKGKKLKRK